MDEKAEMIRYHWHPWMSRYGWQPWDIEGLTPIQLMGAFDDAKTGGRG